MAVAGPDPPVMTFSLGMPTAPKPAMLNRRRWKLGRANAGTANGALSTGWTASRVDLVTGIEPDWADN